MNAPRCFAHLSGSGLVNIGAFCRKPAIGEWEGSPRCAYHLTIERKREARRNAPHVHRSWASTVGYRRDGSYYAFCAECGATMVETKR
jgi:hypothetical protein